MTTTNWYIDIEETWADAGLKKYSIGPLEYEGFSDLDDVLTYMINAMYANIQLNLSGQFVAPVSVFITNMLQNLNAIPGGD